MSEPNKNLDGLDGPEMEIEEVFEEEDMRGKLGFGEERDENDFMEELPSEVKRRVKALKNIQVDITKIEARFFEELHLLECKYFPLYKPHFDKRRLITNGNYEPNDEECEFVSSSDNEDLVAEGVAKLSLSGGEGGGETPEKVSGIPNFWLQIFQNVEMLDEMVEPYDEPILKHLTDIQVELTEEPMGFKLLFYFSPNEYFTNSVLVKSYEMHCDLDKNDPFSFEGPEIVKCTGCDIDWKSGKNVTMKTIQKSQKHKLTGATRVVSKTIEVQSFFNFFNPPIVKDGLLPDSDEETQLRLTNDFEVGQYIRERIVPRAVLYYTGEALEEDSDSEEEDEEEGTEGSAEEEEEGEGADDEVPKNRTHRNSRKSQAIKDAKEKECKQQ